jgi:WD40 repeat protein
MLIDLMSETNPYVFISYARADDEPFVERLYHDLEVRGIRVWWDRQSMSTRGLTFLDEIQRAIESVDRVIAVVGPNAARSDYVLYEWDYALLFGKAVVPILRLGDYTSIPGNLTRDLRDDNCPDFRAERSYERALDELERIVREPVVPLGPIRATPALPLSFLPRHDTMKAMRQTLYRDIERPKPVASAAEQTLVLHGMGGSGKSVLAAAFARSIETRRAANDGIIWLEASREAKPADRLANLWLLGSSLDDDPKHYSDENRARTRISQLLSDKGCLIVLDDVWSKEDAEPYLNALGPRCRLLVTTRDAALGVLGRSQALGMLTDAEALALLGRSSGQATDGLPSTANEVAKQCGNLPLALAMVGAMVNSNPDRWKHALRRLRTSRLDKIQFAIPNYNYTNLSRAIQISIDDLKPDEQARYFELAVFPRGVGVPQGPLHVLWEPAGVDADDTIDLIDLFVRRSLARRLANGRILLHDLQFDYVRNRTPDLRALNNCLLDTYAKRCSNGWPSGPDDGYFFQFLPYHLVEAGQQPVLRGLLLNYRWLDAKLCATDVIDLIDDYDRLGDDAETRLVHQTLQLAATGLTNDKAQLRAQIYARLRPLQQDSLSALVEDAQHAAGPWIRPLVPTFTLPGGPLIRTLVGHEGFVNTVVVFDQGRRAISGSHDNTARVWDLERGIEIMKLADHSNVVTAVAVTSDGGCAITVHWDTIKVWDLRKGKQICTFEGTRTEVYALALTPDDRFVISGSSDKTIRIWDLEKGVLAGTLEGHTRDVSALAITPDGRTLISGSRDGRVGVWNLADRKLIRFVQAHEKWIIGLLSDNDDAASASTDDTVKIWKIASGEQVTELTGFHFYSHVTRPIALCPNGSRLVLGGLSGEIGIWDLAKGAAWLLQEAHTAWVTSVDVLPDNRRAISASGDKTIKIWDLEAPLQDQRPVHAYFVNGIAVKSDEGQAVSASPRDGLKVWDLSTLELIQSIAAPHPDRVARMEVHAGMMSMQPGDFLAMALFPDGRRCAWALQDETVRVSYIDASNELARINQPGIRALAVTPDGRYVICALSERSPANRSAIAVWDWEANRMASSIAEIGDPCALAVTLDGRKLLVGSWIGHFVHVLDLPSCNRLYSFEAHTGAVGAFAFSPDHRSVYSASFDKTIRAWDLETGKETMRFLGHAAGVNAVAIFPDGRCIVSGSDDCSLKVWDATNGQNIATCTGDASMRSAAVAPDGLIIAGDTLGRVHFVRLEAAGSESQPVVRLY